MEMTDYRHITPLGELALPVLHGIHHNQSSSPFSPHTGYVVFTAAQACQVELSIATGDKHLVNMDDQVQLLSTDNSLRNRHFQNLPVPRQCDVFCGLSGEEVHRHLIYDEFNHSSIIPKSYFFNPMNEPGEIKEGGSIYN